MKAPFRLSNDGKKLVDVLGFEAFKGIHSTALSSKNVPSTFHEEKLQHTAIILHLANSRL